MFKVETATWEEFAEGDLVKRVVAELGSGTLLVALGEMVKEWTAHDFYKEDEYDELIKEFQKTGNWHWVKELEEFKFDLRCAEEPIGYVVFWRDNEVVDAMVLVLFREEHYVNLLIYRLGGDEVG
jgi:hypothetical protein